MNRFLSEVGGSMRAALAVLSCLTIIATAPVACAQDGASVYAVARQYSAPAARNFFRPNPPSYATPSFGAQPDRSRRVSTVLRLDKDGKDGDRHVGDDSLTISTAYCVRTCDGFFFPVANAGSGSSGAHEAACARTCPGAETAVYTASAGSKGIDDAVNRAGQGYQRLVSAYAFRSGLDNACTCAAPRGPARNHSVLTDFTLRAGDMVMSSEGLKVFRGGRYPYDAEDFSAADNARLSGQERRWVQAAEASSMRASGGAQVSAALQARIISQVNAAKGKAPDLPATQVTEAPATIQSDATDAAAEKPAIRYVGPDRVSP